MREWKTTFLFLLLFTLTAAAGAQYRGKRLILKDGSYQITDKWEIRGERVRYYSRERSDWEELPHALVDWVATEKFNARVDAPGGEGRATEIKEIDKEEAAERAKEAAKTPQVAPGVTLPSSGGVYMLDTYRGQPQLVELVQNGGELNKQMGKNIMRSIINPIAVSSRQTIELKGLRSRVQSHVAQPEIFLDINLGDESNSPNLSTDKTKTDQSGRFQIVKLDKTKTARIIGDLKIYIYGKVKQEQKMIETAAGFLPGNEWLKIYPKKPLEHGEYAVVEMLGPKEMNLYVWDFGVDPGAPENPTSWKPVQSKEAMTGTDESPLLQGHNDKNKKPPKRKD